MPHTSTVVDLIATGTLDAELAALLWLLIEGRVPFVVAGQPGSGRSAFLSAFLDLLPSTVERRVLAGAAEDFHWLADAGRLGWGRAPSLVGGPPTAPADGSRTILIAGRFGEESASDTWGDRARVVVRALSVGYGLATTIRADTLEEVLATLRQPAVALTDDELSHIGVVLVLRRIDDDAGHPGRRRAVVAHYVRPLSRDAGGHLQRLGPAVLATWDERRDVFEHFAWGIVTELAGRIGRQAGDFEAEQARRAGWLAGLVTTGVRGPEAFRRALSGFRVASSGSDRSH